jgi:eight-cysteine-cluster-containing protein
MAKHAIVAMWLVLGAGCAASGSRPARTDGSCFIGGCSGELCSDRTDVFSPCIWRDAYACFADAMCARQGDGGCGWTPTPELEACLASHMR